MPEFYVGQVSEHAVIINAEGRFLILRHNGGGIADSPHIGKWHLPGGRLDKDDQPGLALLREIEEETGLKNVNLIVPCHTSRWGFDDPVKYSVAYLATVQGTPLPIMPDTEDHDGFRWVTPHEFEPLTMLHPIQKQAVKEVLAWAIKLGILAK